jgi:hypothetical protein
VAKHKGSRNRRDANRNIVRFKRQQQLAKFEAEDADLEAEGTDFRTQLSASGC